MAVHRSLLAQIIWFYFGFRDRISRFQWWLLQLSMLVLGTIVIYIDAVTAEGVPAHEFQSWRDTFGVSLVFVLLGLAANVKRWHDRDKSGWWVLISLIPYVGFLWQIIELGFLPGTKGTNRYGLDPEKGLDEKPVE